MIRFIGYILKWLDKELRYYEIIFSFIFWWNEWMNICVYFYILFNNFILVEVVKK